MMACVSDLLPSPGRRTLVGRPDQSPNARYASCGSRIQSKRSHVCRFNVSAYSTASDIRANPWPVGWRSMRRHWSFSRIHLWMLIIAGDERPGGQMRMMVEQVKHQPRPPGMPTRAKFEDDSGGAVLVSVCRTAGSPSRKELAVTGAIKHPRPPILRSSRKKCLDAGDFGRETFAT